MHQSDEAFLAGILAEIERLERRPVAEVGVPMFIVPEDLREGAEEVPEAGAPSALGEDFARAVRLMERHRGELGARDVARIVEVLAERAFGETSPARA